MVELVKESGITNCLVLFLLFGFHFECWYCCGKFDQIPQFQIISGKALFCGSLFSLNIFQHILCPVLMLYTVMQMLDYRLC